MGQDGQVVGIAVMVSVWRSSDHRSRCKFAMALQRRDTFVVAKVTAGTRDLLRILYHPHQTLFQAHSDCCAKEQRAHEAILFHLVHSPSNHHFAICFATIGRKHKKGKRAQQAARASQSKSARLRHEQVISPRWVKKKAVQLMSRSPRLASLPGTSMASQNTSTLEKRAQSQ